MCCHLRAKRLTFWGDASLGSIAAGGLRHRCESADPRNRLPGEHPERLQQTHQTLWIIIIVVVVVIIIIIIIMIITTTTTTTIIIIIYP